MLAELSIVPLGRGEHSLRGCRGDPGRRRPFRYPLQVHPLRDVPRRGDGRKCMDVVRRCHAKARERSRAVVTAIRIEDEEGATDKLTKNVTSVEEKLGRQLAEAGGDRAVVASQARGADGGSNGRRGNRDGLLLRGGRRDGMFQPPPPGAQWSPDRRVADLLELQRQLLHALGPVVRIFLQAGEEQVPPAPPEAAEDAPRRRGGGVRAWSITISMADILLEERPARSASSSRRSRANRCRCASRPRVAERDLGRDVARRSAIVPTAVSVPPPRRCPRTTSRGRSRGPSRSRTRGRSGRRRCSRA